MRSRKASTLNGKLFKSDVENNKSARRAFVDAEKPMSGKLYGTLHCNRCYKPTLIVLEVGDDGYRLDRVESNCKHIPERNVVVV